MDRRRRVRQRALLSGKFVCDHPVMSVDCTIRDITEFGARVVVGPGVVVPRRGWLINVREGSAHQVDVVWRAGGLLGLRYGETIDVRRPGSPRLKHLHHLWTACAGR